MCSCSDTDIDLNLLSSIPLLQHEKAKGGLQVFLKI